MFFSQIVLAKKGPLAKIWLAGHWDTKMTKTQIFKTNIPKSIKHILQPHLPMALRMSSHLLLGVVRIYSKKAKYLLDDCSEAVIKLKDLAKTLSKIDLPQVPVDPQSLLTSGPKKGAVKEVDIFLRGIENIEDLVLDTFYDPSKLPKTDKEIQMEKAERARKKKEEEDAAAEAERRAAEEEEEEEEERDRAMAGAAAEEMIPSEFLSSQQPKTPTGGDLSPRRSITKADLREGERPAEITPSRPIGTPAGDMGDLGHMFNPSEITPGLLPTLEGGLTPGQTPKTTAPVDDLIPQGADQQIDFGDFGAPDIGGYDDQLPIPGSPRFGGDDEMVPPPHHEGDVAFETPGETAAVEEEGLALGERAGGDTSLSPTKQAEAAEAVSRKKKQMRALRKKIQLSKREERKYSNPQALLSNDVPMDTRDFVVRKSRPVSFKQDKLKTIRKGMSDKFKKFYDDTLQFSFPDIMGVRDAVPLNYIRSRRSYSVMMDLDTETGFLEKEDKHLRDLGIPEFDQFDMDLDKAREKVLLGSINRLGVSDEEEESSPEKKRKIFEPTNEADRILLSNLETEIDDRKLLGYPLDYMAGDDDIESRDLERREKELKEAEEKRKRMEEEDFGGPRIDFPDQSPTIQPFSPGQGFAEYVPEIPDYPLSEEIPGAQQEKTEEELEQQRAEERSRRDREREQQQKHEKKIWSQKTQRMHSILNTRFQQKDTVLMLDDLIGTTSSRSIAAGIFYELLMMKTKVLVDLEQRESFGEIYITKSENFDYTDDWTIVDEVDQDNGGLR
eukprot:gene6732-8348_t